MDFKISKWNVIMFNNFSNTKVPVIYVYETPKFVKIAEENNFALMCNIAGTNTIYDGQNIPGMVTKSGIIGLYMITLWSEWYGYPDIGKEGTVRFC